MVQLSHPYMTTGKTIALTRWTFVSKMMSPHFNTLSSQYIIRNSRLDESQAGMKIARGNTNNLGDTAYITPVAESKE